MLYFLLSFVAISEVFSSPIPTMKWLGKASIIAGLSFVPIQVLASTNTIEGIITLASNTVVPSDPNAALYITVKQDSGLWTSGVRNIKSPPVLTKRIAPVSGFPLKFSLTEQDDSTPEGRTLAQQWKLGKLPLLLSVRLDSDGTASTRSPDDLVGQGSTKLTEGSWESVDVPLSGRGIAGKFITQPSK